MTGATFAKENGALDLHTPPNDTIDGKRDFGNSHTRHQGPEPPPESNDAIRPLGGEDGAAKTVDKQLDFYRPCPRLPQGDLTAKLIAPIYRSGERYSGDYRVQFGGELITVGHNAELDACRVLIDRGYRGKLVFIDSNTGKPRLIVNDIAKAAKLTVKEAANGPRFCRFQALSEGSPVTEVAEVGP